MKDAIQSILGIPDNSAVSVAYLVGATTGLTAVAFRDTTANPSTTGYLQRNGVNLLFHDGTAARTLVNTGTAQTLDAKTLSNVVIAQFADQAADADAAGELQRNSRRLVYYEGGSAVRLSGAISVNTTTVGNVGGGEDDLMSFPLPASTLNANGRLLRVTGLGAFAANANTKTLRAKFGATSITCNATTTAPNGLVWKVVFDVIRTGSNTQLLNLACNAGAVWQGSSEATPAETDSGAITIKFTGESAAAATDDIVQRAMIVELLN